MNAKQTIAIIIPIAIFIIKKYISLYITIPVLIAGCIITYYLYAKSDEDKYLRGALSPVSYTHLTLPTICSV